MILTLEETIELKHSVMEQFGVHVHLHDCCGGQRFSIDNSDNNIRYYIQDFFKKKGLKAVFSADGRQFFVQNDD